MSIPLPTPTSCDPVVTNIKGDKGDTGAAGSNGTDGVSAFTYTTINITIPAAAANTPAVGAALCVTVEDNTWLAFKEIVFVGMQVGDGTWRGGHFQVVDIGTGGQIQLKFLAYDGDSAPAEIIAKPAIVTPAGLKGDTGSVAGTELLIANNLNDVADAATAWSNLGGGASGKHADTYFFTTAGLLGGLSAGNKTTLRTNIGAQTQAAILDALANLTGSLAADKMAYFSAAGAATITSLTAFARTILAASTAAATRALMDLLPNYGLL